MTSAAFAGTDDICVEVSWPEGAETSPLLIGFYLNQDDAEPMTVLVLDGVADDEGETEPWKGLLTNADAGLAENPIINIEGNIDGYACSYEDGVASIFVEPVSALEDPEALAGKTVDEAADEELSEEAIEVSVTDLYESEAEESGDDNADGSADTSGDGNADGSADTSGDGNADGSADTSGDDSGADGSADTSGDGTDPDTDNVDGEGVDTFGADDTAADVDDAAQGTIDIFRLDAGTYGSNKARCGKNCALPATGINGAIAPRPLSVNYSSLGLSIELPSIGVSAEILNVPFVDDAYAVTWLGGSAGLLEGSAMPGEGQTWIAAHNHIDAEEYGPFANLGRLNAGDRVFIADHTDGTMTVYEVYANLKVAADDAASVYDAADEYTDSLTLITCEDENVDGGYVNRRVICAKPL